MKNILGIIMGILFGFAGAYLFQKSLPPKAGSPEDQLEKVQHSLIKLQAQYDDVLARSENRRPRDSTSARAREIAERLKKGEQINLDDILHTTKPLMRDLSPLLDRIRLQNERKSFDSIIGNAAREYNLTDNQQNALREWLEKRAEKNAERFNQVIESETTGFVDYIKASDDLDRLDGIDEFMESTLTGDDLQKYTDKRLDEKLENVQTEADYKMERLDRVVDLTDDQRDQVFVIMAKNAKDYDPQMEFETSSTQDDIDYSSRDTALFSVLTHEQKVAYEANREKRRIEAEQEMREIGLSLPKDWDLLEENEF